MKKITTILFGVACFIIGATTAIVIFLNTLLDIDFIRDSLIATLKKEITDNVYKLFYGRKPKYSDYYRNPEYKIKYQRYSDYYKTEDIDDSFSKAIARIRFIKDIQFKTYNDAEEVVCNIRRHIDDYGYVTINDMLCITGHQMKQFFGGGKWGYDDQFLNMFKVNPNGKFGHWTIDIAYNPIRLNRE